MRLLHAFAAPYKVKERLIEYIGQAIWKFLNLFF